METVAGFLLARAAAITSDTVVMRIIDGPEEGIRELIRSYPEPARSALSAVYRIRRQLFDMP